MKTDLGEEAGVFLGDSEIAEKDPEDMTPEEIDAAAARAVLLEKRKREAEEAAAKEE